MFSLSLVICTYNRSTLLSKTFDCLLSQINNDNTYEIIVVDNNSTDDTSYVCSLYSEKFLCNFVYYLESRQGKCFALNSGIKLASHCNILFLDDDVTFNNNLIDSVIFAMQSFPDCSVFGGKIIPLLEPGCSMPEWVRQEEPHYNAEGPLGDHNKGDSVRSYYEDDMGTPCGANFFVRKRIFDQFGFFNENLNCLVKNLPMAEDSEFCYRLKKNKVMMLYIPQVCVYHRTPKDKLTKKYFINYASRMARAYVHASKISKNTKILFHVPRYFYRSILTHFVIFLFSICRNESEDLKFSKYIEFYRLLSISYWYIKDRHYISYE